MNPVDAIVMALTPGSAFNQAGKVFRSAKALSQFATIEQQEVLGLVAEHLADQVTIRPSAKRPENGPLIALTQFVPMQDEPAQVQIVAGNAVAPADEEVALEFPIPEDQAEAVKVMLDEEDEPDEEA